MIKDERILERVSMELGVLSAVVEKLRDQVEYSVPVAGRKSVDAYLADVQRDLIFADQAIRGILGENNL